jgi:hypothetical protein
MSYQVPTNGLRHGDVITLQTAQTTAGVPGWLYLDSGELPQTAYGIDLPISDKRFLWQVQKLSPNTTGGNQDATWITEGDDVVLKSLANGLVLQHTENTCGISPARATIADHIAIGNYYTQGQGSIGTVRFVSPQAAYLRGQAVHYGSPYSIQFNASGCYLNVQPHALTGTAGQASLSNAFIIQPSSGAPGQPGNQLQDAVAWHAQVESRAGSGNVFAQQVRYPAQRAGELSAMTTIVQLPGNSKTPWIVGAVVGLIVILVLGLLIGRATKGCKQNQSR